MIKILLGRGTKPSYQWLILNEDGEKEMAKVGRRVSEIITPDKAERIDDILSIKGYDHA